MRHFSFISQKFVKISDIYDVVTTSYDLMREEDVDTDLYINMMKRMMERGGDNSYEIHVFDDSRGGNESFAAIIIDHYRKQLVVVFRATMMCNIRNFASNQSLVYYEI